MYFDSAVFGASFYDKQIFYQTLQAQIIPSSPSKSLFISYPSSSIQVYSLVFLFKKKEEIKSLIYVEISIQMLLHLNFFWLLWNDNAVITHLSIDTFHDGRQMNEMSEQWKENLNIRYYHRFLFHWHHIHIFYFFSYTTWSFFLKKINIKFIELFFWFYLIFFSRGNFIK